LTKQILQNDVSLVTKSNSNIHFLCCWNGINHIHCPVNL